MKSIAFFNSKGGVGKTTLGYHLSWMFAELGYSVVAVDLDPQANLTAMFLDEDRLEEVWPDGDHPQSILGSVAPILCGLGDVSPPHVEEVIDNLGLIIGDLGLSRFEARLSSAWSDCLVGDEAALRIESAFHRTILKAAEMWLADLVLIGCRPQSGRNQPCGRHCSRLRGVTACSRSVLAAGSPQHGTYASGVAQRLAGPRSSAPR